MALAMGMYEIGFSYRLNGRKVFALPPGLGLGERVAGLLAPGKKFVAVSGEIEPVVVSGFIAPPDLAQSNRNAQYVFINGRYIQSPVLSHAFAAGYGELLPKGNFPIGALLLEVDPREVDVNVHPAKTEVRLSREREIHDALYRLIKEALRQDGIIPKLQVPDQPTPGFTRPVSTDRDYTNAYRSQNVIPGITQHPPTGADFVKEIVSRSPGLPPEDTAAPIQVDPATGEIIESVSSEKLEPTGLRLIGRFDDLYLLFQAGEELLVIDQHTAHERVLYEETLRQMDNEGGTAQNLLLPVQVELGAEQFALLDEAAEVLRHSGFAIEPFGGQTVRIEAIPAVLSRRSPEKAFRSILDDIASLKKSGYDLKKAVAQSVACRSAIMAGDRLTDREAIGLVASLLKCDNRYSCPHGRPTFIKMSREDLDKQFGRG
jgi:DNA mismatch repair protein MutL